jgi:predicted transposase YbfD/YdcC
MGCQTDIAQKILEGGGEYILALKGNQGNQAEQKLLPGYYTHDPKHSP